ncbi:MFS transporter, PAT family, solute carrier family 33 (acetyl-CoA transporter), member 1 [Plasmodium inui San Antonio 1]|uniref:MFS transporter, PAT family, solute carrier family 33 (Acetyl-CoA transporter), member 1 n=1 Tax=Plasmodium inui San Antonio 1 TaxID=1237626 RepID=W7A604_9APIC|nr:MFS transporter, PAT family, solute carrier family 33 (acetyl-CoA transporter), member 1 [Plasmodium inui San Antonio 1]EUD64499.1 MFS transporter, PAT family, solute carrier family 33 (acetyl-CoA transporter), member 1 [Plasmodium inui San Antonio 1]
MTKIVHDKTDANVLRDRKQKHGAVKDGGSYCKDEGKVKVPTKGHDFYNIIFLLLLYTIQGVPIGVSSVVPLIIQDKVSYSQLSILSLVTIPFSLKLLWAPLVDSVYHKKIGRRKSWIIPLQLICSFSMIFCGNHVSVWLGERGNMTNLYFLTSFFFVLFFLMATQDIAVDGWALTILSEENRGLASTCNILGQNIGYCVSQLSFLTLNNKNVCFYIFRKYIQCMHSMFNQSSHYRHVHESMDMIYPSFQPFVDMNIFLKFWGVFILALTILTCFKKEMMDDNGKEKNNGAVENAPGKKGNHQPSQSDKPNESSNEFANSKDTYKNLYQLLFLPPMKIFIFIFLLNRFPFASVEVGTNFKMLKKGISKEEFAIFNPIFIPISIISSAIIGKITKNIKPLSIYYYGYLLRYLSNIILSTLLPLTEYIYSNKSELPQVYLYSYYLYIFVAQVFNHFCIDLMTVSSMSFQNIISDPEIGGTYMTFLNTVNNMGSHWSTIFLWLLDYTDRTVCYGGKCLLIDGYYTQMVFSFIIGILINKYITKCITKLQAFPIEDWRTKNTNGGKKIK